MDVLLSLLCVVVMVLNFFVLGAVRIRGVVRIVALQGLLVGLMPLLAHEHSGLRAVLLALATMALKAVVLPGILLRAVRDLDMQKEAESLIGPTNSLLVGAAGTALAWKFAGRLPLASAHLNGMLVPASLATVLAGFIILTTRTRAVSQVVGYLVLENGIFIFGVLLLGSMPLLVEMGGLLDLFVAVFIMGILIGRLNRGFPGAGGHEESLNEERPSLPRSAPTLPSEGRLPAAAATGATEVPAR